MEAEGSDADEAARDELQDEVAPLGQSMLLRKDATVGEILQQQEQQQQQQQQAEDLRRSSTVPSLLQRRSSSQRRLSLRDQRRAELKQRFRRIARIVVIMVNWINIILKRKSYTDDENIKVADSLKGFQTDEYSLSFDPAYYRAKREIDLTAEMKYTLQLEPAERSSEQLQALMFGLQSLGTFNEYPLEIQEKLARVAFLQSVPAGRLIIRQGHFGHNFYIIVSGKALVNVMNSAGGDAKSSIVARLGQGQSFGEIALLQQVTRTASIVSQEPMQLLAIGRDDFQEIFTSAEPGQLPAHVQFLASCAFMRSFPVQLLLQAPSACLLTFYRRNALVVRDSKTDEHVVVLRSGSCRVLKQLSVNETDQPAAAAATADFPDRLCVGSNRAKVDTGLRRQAQMFDISISKKRLALNSALGRHHRVVEVSREKPEFENPHQPQEQKKKTVAVEISTLKPGDVFGLADVVFREEKNLEVEGSASVALISSGAECILLNKAFFVQHASDAVRRDVRAEARPYPEDSVFEENYYTQVAWDRYRRAMLHGAIGDISERRNEL